MTGSWMDGNRKKRVTALVAFAALCMIAVVAENTISNGSLSLGDTELRMIVSDSMDGGEDSYEIGSIPKDSIVVIEHISDISEISVGDVVAYRLSGHTIVHRVASIDGETGIVYTKGDANYAAEEINADQIYGKVIAVSTTMGLIISTIQSDTTIMAAMVICMLVMLSSVISIVNICSARRRTDSL